MNPSYFDNYINNVTPTNSDHYKIDKVRKILTTIAPLLVRIDHIFPKNIEPEENKSLKELYLTLQVINDILAPFKKYDISYELSVAGGAVSDILCNNSAKTKDMDIVLHFPALQYHEILEYDLHDNFHNLVMDVAPTLRRKKYEQEDFCNILELVIKNYLSVKESVIARDNSDENHLNINMQRVITIEDSKLPKPVDIIVSKIPVLNLVEKFDFNICKSFIPYISNHSHGLDIMDRIDENTENPHLMLLDYIVPLEGCVSDIENKTLSMSFNNLHIDQVKHFMNDHFPRLQEKFPDYKLVMNEPRNDPQQALKNYYMLESQLTKPEGVEAKKIKI